MERKIGDDLYVTWNGEAVLFHGSNGFELLKLIPKEQIELVKFFEDIVEGKIKP